MLDSPAGSQHGTPSDYETLKAEAERLYAEQSYALAHELYLKASALKLTPTEARWVDFRLVDTLWRSQAGTPTTDPSRLDQARQQLEALIRDIHREEDRDRVWAEVHESLGDFWWTRRETRNWNEAWPHYQQALDWWAGARDIELARQRYLGIVWRMAEPPEVEPYYYYGSHGNVVPLEILENVLKIAQTETDQAHAHYLIAMTIRHRGGGRDQHQRVPEEFEAALKPGKATDWYDDALYHYAEWMANYGSLLETEDGNWRREPDYGKALELFRRLINEYGEGETRYYDQAKDQIEEITRPVVEVSVSNIFLPDSEIQYHLSWRNVKRINLALYRVDLTRDVNLSNMDGQSHNWIEGIRLAGREQAKSWTKETGDKGDYKPGEETLRLDSQLPMGAYVIEAKAGDVKARDLILVTDAVVVLKNSGKQALVYFCDALDGSPIAGGTVKLWEPLYLDNEWVGREHTQFTNQDGIAVFDLATAPSYGGLFACANLNDRQAFSLSYRPVPHRERESWRIYAFTDRPAYRPGEQAWWKVVARRYNGSVYSTPAHQTLDFEIEDPRGSKVKGGQVTLNAFGSAWDSLDLTESMPLGEYKVSFRDRGRLIGSATLFRLEEYKLPEFRVSVQTPEEEGRKKAFKLGERVEVNVQADYYFGGPVVNATVEVLVYQNPFSPRWSPPRPFPWFYEDVSARYRSSDDRGQIVKRETLKTDATGKARLTFETPRGAQQDFEYRIEARVTDASRREIIGSGTVRVTRQRYYVYLHPKHYLYRPQDKVTVDIQALDANNQPVSVEGMVKLTRDHWYEIWLDPRGRELTGDELKRLRERSRVFPPPPKTPGERPWQLKFQGYQHEDLLSQMIKTDAEGKAEFTFTPEREGYYRVAWSSQDRDGSPIKTETTVWVATNATTELGYRHGGLEIIVDKDTFRAGDKAVVMVTVPTNDRYVLFSIEGEDLYSYQLVHLTGTAKLIQVPIGEEHVPNVFLSGAMVSDRQLFSDTKEIIVPPIEHFLSVEVRSDRQEYRPREEGTITVTTRDHNGKPVVAEVALGLVDESVYSIQQDYAGDPRQFYYGDKRRRYIQTQSTFQQKHYAKLVEGAEKRLIDERDRAAMREDRYATASVAGGVIGGVMGREGAALAPGQHAKLAMTEAPAVRVEDRATPPAGPEVGQESAVHVRTDFRATVFWQPDIMTGADGQATVRVRFPDSLTTWTATARVATTGNQFGMVTASTRTNQPLIVRLQAPRFFVVGDEVIVSAVVNNNTDEPIGVVPLLEAQGVIVKQALYRGRPVRDTDSLISVPPHGEDRLDWVVSVEQPGLAKLKVTARGDKYADAMEKTYPIFEHGIEKFVAKSGKVHGDDMTVKLDIPKERKRESTTLTVQVTPSLAVMMLDALPYLIDYPYGCTEQTMSRFLPAAIVVQTLRDLGLRPEAIIGKVFGGIEQQYVNQTQPGGRPDLRQLEELVEQGLKRLYDFQHDDGGWGWWKEGESDHFMTAYIVWGLTLARDAELDVRSDVLERGVEYLEKELVEEEIHYDLQAWMLHALAAYHASSGPRGLSQFQTRAFENLWTNRDKLNAYTRALLALSAHYFGYADRARTLVRNLENGVKQDRAPDASILVRGQPSHEAALRTAHWGEDGLYWRWSDGGVEATSFALRALLAIEPQHKLIEPVMNWLVRNRRGAQWSNTRDTAIAILALNDYLRKSGELNPDIEYELFVNGHSIVTKRLTAEDALSAPSQFAISPELISDGTNDIRIVRRSGRGPIYFSARALFFSLEEPIMPVGNEIFVRRQYYRLVGRPTLLKGYIYDRVPLNDGESVTSGDRIEAVITIEAKNNYEYLVLEDLKPAGVEAVQIRSGEPLFARELRSGVAPTLDLEPQIQDPGYTGRRRWVYQELRDRKVALFVDNLPEGVWEIRYDLRAEVPGTFHALPVVGYAMYVPEIRGNGVEVQVKVEDK